MRIVSLPPTRSKVCSWSTRSILACKASGMSPISSRNSVPPLVCSNLPMRLRSAPVKAPFSCPNSSLSRSCSGMAAQFSARNEALARAALAGDQHRHVLGGDAADRLVHLAHGGTRADDGPVNVGLLVGFGEHGRRAHPPGHFHGFADHAP